MSKIVQMDDHLANKIAAGEVVERPSGIVKELIENAIDAQATNIVVEIMLGGLEKITVLDNGEGMDEVDLVQAFQRHSTSKIKTVQDLAMISSLGFRGEALPSIASVSNVVAHSRNHVYRIVHGRGEPLQQSHRIEGFRIEVSELFYQFPARLKYLKTPAYEASLILALVQQFALGYPQIQFKLISDGKKVFESSGNNKLEDVLYQKYGRDILGRVVAFKGENDDFKIAGQFVSVHIHRGNKRHIALFLNRRMIRYHRITQMIVDCFHRYMPLDRFPIIVLNIETDLQLVDVNVHPNKWEIRLSKEYALLGLLEKTLLSALQIKTSEKQSAVLSTYQSQQRLDLSEFKVPQPDLFVVKEEFPSFEAVSLVDVAPSVTESESMDVVLDRTERCLIEVIGQHHGNYILAQDENSLYVFDQHASMERIRYEFFLNCFESSTFSQQLLLTPLIFTTALLDLNVFEGYGLFFERLSDRTVVLRTLPTWMAKVEHENFVQSLLDLASEGEKTLSVQSVLRKKIATMACHSSVRFNQKLSNLQLQKIVDDLMVCENPYHCPHGRPTFVKVDSKTLMKEFSR